MPSFELITEFSFKEEKDKLEKALSIYINNKPLNPLYKFIETFNPFDGVYLKEDFRKTCRRGLIKEK